MWSLERKRGASMVSMNSGQRELNKRIPSSTRDRIGCLIEAAYGHRVACRRTIRTLVNLKNRTAMSDAYPSREPVHGDIVWIEKRFWSVNDG